MVDARRCFLNRLRCGGRLGGHKIRASVRRTGTRRLKESGWSPFIGAEFSGEQSDCPRFFETSSPEHAWQVAQPESILRPLYASD